MHDVALGLDYPRELRISNSSYVTTEVFKMDSLHLNVATPILIGVVHARGTYGLADHFWGSREGLAKAQAQNNGVMNKPQFYNITLTPMTYYVKRALQEMQSG